MYGDVVRWPKNSLNMSKSINGETVRLMNDNYAENGSDNYKRCEKPSTVHKECHEHQLQPHSSQIATVCLPQSSRHRQFNTKKFCSSIANKFIENDTISNFLSNNLIKKCRLSTILYRLVYSCIIISVICSDKFILSVNCDDSMGVAGHYTPTWAVHITGGDHMAEQVARDHGMDVVGKVSDQNSF